MPDISGRCALLREKNSPWFYGELCQSMGLASDLHTELLSMLTGLSELFLSAYADKYQRRWEKEETLLEPYLHKTDTLYNIEQ